MSQILLNTIGTNKKYSYYVPVSQPVATDKTVSVADKKLNDKKNLEMLTAGLSSLAVLGMAGVGVKVYRKKKLNRQIFALSTQIKSEYLAAKNTIIEEFNKAGLPESFSKNNLPNNKITSSKYIRDTYAFYHDSYNKMISAQKEAVANIKTSIANLSTDSEWKELRKLRKQMLKDMQGKDVDKHDVAVRKIPLINDMLSLKLHPEKENIFLARTSANVDDVRELLKKDFASGEAFDAEYKKLAKFNVVYDSMDDFFVNYDRISLRDLFKNDYEAYNSLKDKMDIIKSILKQDIPSVQKQWSEKLNSLASDFRKQESVIKLKRLVASK